MALQKLPTAIRAIEVKYYRSINSARVRNCSKFNILTGPNDVGKSNLLRALNLFFNEADPNGDDIVFEDEFSHKRLEQVRKESVKGKQFVQITVEFNRGPFFQQTLPERFRVTKTWYRDSYNPEVTDDLQAKINTGRVDTTITKARASLKRFLGRISFTYIPAIKDQMTFDEVLSNLQSVMFESSEKAGSPLTTQIDAFNAELASQAAELRSDFTSSTGIQATIALPSSHKDLFQAFKVKTDGIAGEAVSLDKRGDGIRVRFIPAILHYIAERSNQFHIWGFEEPENSMEFKRAFELCRTMRERYSNSAQIFVTTHSPAFIDLEEQEQSIYVARREDESTVFLEVNSKTAPELFGGDPELAIAQELGHIALMSKLHKQLDDAIEKASAISATTEMLEREIDHFKKPLILTEGKTDPKIIQHAWKHLRGSDCPFIIRSCNTLPDDDANEAAGASVLSGALRTIRSDAPQVTIGVFDRDKEGIEQFKLDKNFQITPENPSVKAHKNGKSYAILLPYPPAKESFAAFENLPIEFLFDLEHLETKVDGQGLSLDYQELIMLCGGKKVSSTKSTSPEHLSIKSGKVHFADKVLSTLPASAFAHFEPLIRAVDDILTPAPTKAKAKAA